jgi:DNA processing protein
MIYLAAKYNGDWNKIYEAIKNKEYVDQNEVLSTVKEVESNVNCLTIIDEDYPDEFKQIYKPPFVIFYKGKISLIRSNYVLGITGNDIKLPFNINDIPYAVAHLSFDNFNGDQIVIHNDGIKDYNSKNDLVLSEYYSKVSNAKDTKAWSSRLLVGLSKGIIIDDIKTDYTSIALGYALAIDKPVGLLTANNNFELNHIQSEDDMRRLLRHYQEKKDMSKMPDVLN